MNRAFFTCGMLALAILGAGIYLTVIPAAGGIGDRVHQIICYHLALSWGAVMCFFTNFVASICYLAYRRPEADALALATAEVGLVFCSVLLISGALWSHYLFAAWWIRSTIMTGASLLCLIYMSYLLLRYYANLGQTSVLAAVVGIFAFLDVPLTYVSVAMRNSRAPMAAELEPNLHAGSDGPLVWGSVTFTVFAAAAVWVRYRAERLQQEADEQEVSRIGEP